MSRGSQNGSTQTKSSKIGDFMPKEIEIKDFNLENF